MNRSGEAVFSIFRGTEEGGEVKEYSTKTVPGMVVLDAVLDIQAKEAPDLAVRCNCTAGKCGSCSAEINGIPRLMCKTKIKDLPSNKPIVVRPLKSFPVIKDLVTDISWNYEILKKIPSFTIGRDTDWRMYQYEVDRIQEFRKCIECFLCQDTCHVIRSHDKKDEYFGPCFLVKLAELEMHPLDQEDRISLIKETAGIGWCNITKCCTEVCPESIRITDNAIIPLKERVVDRYYDYIKRVRTSKTTKKE